MRQSLLRVLYQTETTITFRVVTGSRQQTKNMTSEPVLLLELRKKQGALFSVHHALQLDEIHYTDQLTSLIQIS